VADHRRYVTGKFIEVIGHYNPVPRGKEVGLQLDVEKANEWIRKGAQPSDTVKTLLKTAQAQKA
jgi:small subunit ribosomal protein S16